MMKTAKLLLVFSLLGAAALVSAQGNADQEINLDENVQIRDLGIKEQNILPDNPFYFIKEWNRRVRLFFTINAVKKLELTTIFSSEKLAEIKGLIYKKASSDKIIKATDAYEKTLDETGDRAKKINATAKNNQNIDKFLGKYATQQILHQRILQKLETQVSPEVFKKIEEARESHLERFGQVMTKLEDRNDKLQEKMENSLNEQNGSKFKNFKNLEVLINLEDKVPESARNAIKGAEENALKRLKGDLEKMSSEDQDKFKDYILNISGSKEEQLDILERLKEKVKQVYDTPETTKLLKKLENSRGELIKKIGDISKKLDCPLWTPPSPDFCTFGKIVINKGSDGCPQPPKCISTDITIPCASMVTCLEGYITEETGAKDSNDCPIISCKQVCTTQHDPVCGKDGRTYTNECFAGMSSVEVAYKGECSQIDKYNYCQKDSDCACGVRKDTTDCFYGNKKYVNTDKQCPDFCTGIANNLVIKCYMNECTQFSK